LPRGNARKDSCHTRACVAASRYSGSKTAAQQADQAWHKAEEDFKKDWEAAKTKAQADLQQIKSTADQMSSQVSGILNQAISGKLNWKQELDMTLSQMLDALIKYVFEMVAYMKMGDTMQEASQAASKGNMIGQLANYFAQALGLQSAAKATTAVSDAGTGASGAFSSAAQVPYIGYLIAPAAAASAFADVMSYAEGGFDVGPGRGPVAAMLHPNEVVLPADIAGGMKQLIASGGGGGPRNINVTSNVNALDARSINDIIDGAHASIAKAAAKYHRSGGRTYLG
jgi:hypothetical protein